MTTVVFTLLVLFPSSFFAPCSLSKANLAQTSLWQSKARQWLPSCIGDGVASSLLIFEKNYTQQKTTHSHTHSRTQQQTHTHTHTQSITAPPLGVCVLTDVCGVDAEKHKAKQKQKKKLQMIGLGRGVVRISNDVRQLSCIESLRVLFVLKTGQKRKEKQGPKNAPGSTWRKRAKSMTRTKQ